MRRAFVLFASVATASVPFVAEAQMSTISEFVGLFNIFVGMMLTASILLYIGGMITWATRLGGWPSYRTEAIRMLEWAVAVLFVLVALLMIVQFFQKDTVTARYVVSAIVVLIVIWVIASMATSSHEEKKK